MAQKDYLVVDKKFSPEKARARLRHFGKKYLGRPYKYGAKDYDAPKEFDCSSFVQHLYRRVGIDLPRTSIDQADEGFEIEPKVSNLKIGDLVFIKGSRGYYNRNYPGGIGHVLMYFGEKKLIHACNKSSITNEIENKVITEPAKPYLELKGFRVVKRIIEDEEDQRTISLFEN